MFWSVSNKRFQIENELKLEPTVVYTSTLAQFRFITRFGMN